MVNEFIISTVETDLPNKKIIVTTNNKIDPNSIDDIHIEIMERNTRTQAMFTKEIKENTLEVILTEFPSPNSSYIFYLKSLTNILGESTRSGVRRKLEFKSTITREVEILSPSMHEVLNELKVKFAINKLSDKEDENHNQILPNELFYTTKNNGVVNVSVMHHPLDFIKDKKDIEKAMDELYPIQFYGHVHHQSIEKNGTLKIFSGAIMPPKGESNCEDGYEPVFNIIEFKDGHGVIIVTVNPYQWEWTSKNDGRFNAIQPEPSYQINVDDSSQYALSIEKTLKLPKGVTKKEIEVEFLQSTKSEEIIHKMYNAFEFQNDAVADASTFFRRVKDEDRYVELYNFIHE